MQAKPTTGLNVEPRPISYSRLCYRLADLTLLDLSLRYALKLLVLLQIDPPFGLSQSPGNNLTHCLCLHFILVEMGLRRSDPREDRSDVIEVATYALTGALILCFIARQVMKAIVFRKVALDDVFILLATVCEGSIETSYI